MVLGGNGTKRSFSSFVLFCSFHVFCNIITTTAYQHPLSMYCVGRCSNLSHLVLTIILWVALLYRRGKEKLRFQMQVFSDSRAWISNLSYLCVRYTHLYVCFLHNWTVMEAPESRSNPTLLKKAPIPAILPKSNCTNSKTVSFEDGLCSSPSDDPEYPLSCSVYARHSPRVSQGSSYHFYSAKEPKVGAGGRRGKLYRQHIQLPSMKISEHLGNQEAND